MTGTIDKRWQVTIEDAGNDEAIIPLPDELIELLGWKEGDEVSVDSIKQGELIITKLPATSKQEKVMTTNAERSRAVLQTMEFLDELAKRSDLPEDVKQEAKRLQRHFPSAHALENTAKAVEKFCPDFAYFASKDESSPKLEALFEKMKKRDPA